ncbi:MAG: class II SORL domain-containing protein [Zestosphaera sp.]
MRSFCELIYSPERAPGEAITKIETHTPRIEAPDTVKVNEAFEVRILVGPHPNTVEHSIRRIELYFFEEGRPFNPLRLATVELEPIYSEPDVKLKIKLKKSGVIYAVEYCNIHGLWEARKEIKATE